MILSCAKGDMACVGASELLSLSACQFKSLKRHLPEQGEVTPAHNCSQPGSRRLYSRVHQAASGTAHTTRAGSTITTFVKHFAKSRVSPSLAKLSASYCAKPVWNLPARAALHGDYQINVCEREGVGHSSTSSRSSDFLLSQSGGNKCRRLLQVAQLLLTSGL